MISFNTLLSSWWYHVAPMSFLHFVPQAYTFDLCLKWKEFAVLAKQGSLVLLFKIKKAKRFNERKCLQNAMAAWCSWVEVQKKTQAVAMERLHEFVSRGRLKLTFAAWCSFTKDSRRIKEVLKRLNAEGWNEISSKLKGGCIISAVNIDILLKIFRYLNVRDLLNCAEVCCEWKSVIQSGQLWSRINFSVEKEWLGDNTVQQILRNYRTIVIHLNLRGCTSLNWPSFQSISECKNLQELNISECVHVTDMMVQKILKGCSFLLYLNLSKTHVTDKTLKELFRNCLNLQYLSLAYCNRVTDEGFLCLAKEKVCYNLLYLDLSGCTQMTVNGFMSISAGCRLLREVVINDMPTLSDKCVLALIDGCPSLSAISLLGVPHLSNATLEAIVENTSLDTFRLQGNNQLTDVSWQALCRSSRDLRWLHVAECPRLTDASLKSFATLKHLQHLNVSLCSRVGDVGIQYLIESSSCTLRELDISHSRTTDRSVMRILQNLCNLEHLNLSYCEQLTDLCLEWFGGSSIRSLDISGCNIQDRGLALLEGVQLKKLALAGCVRITDAGIEVLCKNVRCLEHMDVSHCAALTEQAIRAISFYCRGLSTLQMAGCPKMTDLAIHVLTSGSVSLRELDISGCLLLTDRTVDYLQTSCPWLSSIRMVFCKGISKFAAMRLKSHVQFWEHNNDDPRYHLGTW
ncbi:dynein regulatory complex subunit 6 isoform X1 [Takifugu flavidus]|nr:dynein regulatory complex subunit 6 isoform X1 [Takifugu flavidus]